MCDDVAHWENLASELERTAGRQHPAASLLPLQPRSVAACHLLTFSNFLSAFAKLTVCLRALFLTVVLPTPSVLF